MRDDSVGLTSRLSVERDKTAQLEGRVDSLSSTIALLQSQLSSACDERRAAESRLRERDGEYDDAIVEWQQRVRSAEDRVSSLEEELRATRESSASTVSMERERTASLEARVCSLNVTISSLRSRLSTEEREREELRATLHSSVTDHENAIAEWQRRVRSEEDRVASLEEELRRVRDDSVGLTSRLSVEHDKTAQLEGRANHLQQALASAQIQLAEAGTLQTQQEALIATLRTVILQLKLAHVASTPRKLRLKPSPTRRCTAADECVGIAASVDDNCVRRHSFCWACVAKASLSVPLK